VAWFTDADLRRLAGGRSYERGDGYRDAVAEVGELPDGVVATVHGSASYRVRLYDRDGRLAGDCSCPHGQDGAFCKHCVAVGLILLDGAPSRRVDPRAVLETLDRDELVSLLVEQAGEDPVLYRRLVLRAATTDGVDVAALRDQVDGLRLRGFVDYAGASDYAAQADDLLGALADLIAERAEVAGPLLRRTVEHMTSALERIDDSSGVVGEVLAVAVETYAEACQAAPPDPVELARWLVDVPVDGPGWPEIAVVDFADALGEKGLAAYQDHLAELAATLPPDGDQWSHRRSTINHLREQYAEKIIGSVDALVAVLAENLSSGYQYLRIATVLRGAGRPEEALGWVRRGLAAPVRPDSRLADLLAELGTDLGQHLDTHPDALPGRTD